MKDFDFDSKDGIDFDEIIQPIIEEVEKEMELPAVVNPERLKDMQFSYAVLKYLTKGHHAKLSYALNEPFVTVGTISVEASQLAFVDPEWFSRALEFASNTEIYPLTNGKVRMTLTFHGLAHIIK